MIKAVISYLASCSLLAVVSCTPRSSISPVGLRIEHRNNPSVIASSSPRMAWINEPADQAAQGLVQSAYHIIVASTEDNIDRNIGDTWDSGIVESDESYLIRYAGSQLLPGKTYWWKVQVRDGEGKMSDWSDAATFGMGLAPDSWEAKWIGAPWQGEEASPDYVQAPTFSRVFNVDKKGLVSAKIFVTGLGYFDLSLNGKKIVDDYLVPNFTNFGSRPGLVKGALPMEDRYTASSVQYLAYDLTDDLKNGENSIEATVGNGFYNTHSHWVEPYGSPRFICRINLDYADGHTETVVTDERWSATPSAVIFNDVYGGEIYDANFRGESVPAVIREAPEGEMRPHTSPTDKILRTLAPRSLTKNADGSYDVDFGEEISGWIALSGMKGNKGDTVSVRYVCESPLGVQRYVMDGSGNESYAPRFTWYVFSRANITGLDTLDASQLRAEYVGTDVRVDASFEASDTILNSICDIWLRTQTDNMHGGIASDCPHRERSPYTGDGQVACAMVMANYDAAAFYEKWIRDMHDAQDPVTGYVPNSAPWQPGCGGGVGWGAAISIIPWEHYLNYGDISILTDNYDAMKRHTDYMTTWITPQGTMHQRKGALDSKEPLYWFNLGDWLPPHGLPDDELVHTFFLWMCADYTAKTAEVLGHDADAAKYKTLADNTRKSFHNKFYDPDRKSYGDYGSNVFALTMGVPDSVKNDVVATLRHEIETDNNSHLNTGICATRHLFTILAENGMADLAYKVMTAPGFPGYVHWLDCGSTTMWENWNGEASHNHPMFGGGLVWLYRELAGINYDPQRPGYRHVIVRPRPVDGLEEISYSKATPYGTVSSTVRNRPEDRSFDVTVPVGSTATVFVPGASESIEIGQGTHTFTF